MHILNFDKIKKPFNKAVITIGNFDGVHLGHQALFKEVIKIAGETGGDAVAMTFDPHPLHFLKIKDRPQLITPHEQKIELIKESGLDALVIAAFDKKFADIPAKKFVKDILVGRLGVNSIVVGPDYTFGRNREGNVSYLKELSPLLGIKTIVVDWISDLAPGMDTRISSTMIRGLVAGGQLDQAKELLGRDYQVRGRVVRGRDRGGKTLGFPTANIKLMDELHPDTGVYAVTVERNKKIINGVANLGYSPTFDDHIFTVEVHLLDFDKDIYDEKIKVNFIKRLRGEKKFDNIKALSAQIDKDIELARNLFIA